MSKRTRNLFAAHLKQRRQHQAALAALMVASDPFADLGPRCILFGRLQTVKQQFGPHRITRFCLRDEHGEQQILTPSGSLTDGDFQVLLHREVEVVAVPDGRIMRVIKMSQLD
jgi:hypothetical protein